MFCDLEGSTALTEKLGDEKAFALIDEIFGILTQQVHKYEGTVQEFRGDGIMALFGAPIALENAAQRAVSAALAIHQEVTKFSNRVQEETKVPAIRMRIGIHTGPVVLGTIGGDLRLEFQVIGDTVNLAARLETLAEPGTTYVTEETFKQTEGFFRFEALGEKQVKGKETPVKVYRVIAPSSLRTRFDVSAEQGLTPWWADGGNSSFCSTALSGPRPARARPLPSSPRPGWANPGCSMNSGRRSATRTSPFWRAGASPMAGDWPTIRSSPSSDRSSISRKGKTTCGSRDKVQKGLEILGVDVNVTLPFLLEFLSVQGQLAWRRFR